MEPAPISIFMAVHNDFGALGEETACRYLMHHGYRLLSRNWRFQHLEVDIVAEWFGEVIFVEVKTRRNEDLAFAADAVDLEKKKNLVVAAKAYMKYYDLDLPFRFDIITVVGERPPFEIEQIENAFTLEGVAEEMKNKHLRNFF